MIEGIVQTVDAKPRGQYGSLAYNVNVEGAWFGHGFDKPIFTEGDRVAFDVNEVHKNGKVYNNIEVSTVEVKETAAAPAMVKDPSGINAVDRRTVLHASRSSAIELASVLVSSGAQKLPAKGDSMTIITELVQNLTIGFYQEGMSIMKGEWPFDDDVPPAAAEPEE